MGSAFHALKSVAIWKSVAI